MSATVSPDRILKELADLWVATAKQGQAEGPAGVLRAGAMTLVVLADEADDAAGVGETIAALMPEHPARTIHIRLCGPGERAVSARVYAQCWMPFGQRRQICCEQVEITAADAALADLPSLVLPLVAPDLPVILWRRTPRLLGMPEVLQIASMANRIIVDSAVFPDARDALRRLAAAAGSGAVLGDLAWTRLTRWREMLAQVFENRQRLAQTSGIGSIKVSWGGTYDTSARYMAAWIASALPNAATSVSRSDDTPTLRVELAGPDLKVELARRGETLLVCVNGASHHTSLTPPTDYLLMREELRIVRRDPVYERALASAARLAYPTEK